MSLFGAGILTKMNISSKKTRSSPPLDNTVPPGLTSVSTNKGILNNPIVICMKTSSYQMINAFKMKILYAFIFVCNTCSGRVPFATHAATASSVKKAVGRMIAFVISIPFIKL